MEGQWEAEVIANNSLTLAGELRTDLLRGFSDLHDEDISSGERSHHELEMTPFLVPILEDQGADRDVAFRLRVSVDDEFILEHCLLALCFSELDGRVLQYLVKRRLVELHSHLRELDRHVHLRVNIQMQRRVVVPLD